MQAIMLNTSAPQVVTHHENFTGLLDFAYKAIGCDCIEIVHPINLPEPYTMIVDESGALKNLPINPIASVLYGTPTHGWPIVGKAMIMKEAITNDGPDIVSLDDSDFAIVNGIIEKEVSKIKARKEGWEEEYEDY